MLKPSASEARWRPTHWKSRSIARTFTLMAGLVLLATAPARGAGAAPVVSSQPVTPSIFHGDLRELPKVQPPKPGEPRREGPPRRQVHKPTVTPQVAKTGTRDPLLDRQEATLLRRGQTRAFSPPGLNFDGASDTGVVPPDPVGEVGAVYYIHITNGSTGSPFRVYDKTTGALVAGPTDLSALWAGGGACTVGGGDPIVLYDRLAGRWLLSEFANSGNHLCIYVSKTNDPLTGGWYNYDFTTSEFPDYPKYAVWPDAYYVTSNESSPTVYALDRSSMLAGLPATFQRKTGSSLGGFSFQTFTPADLDGSVPPPAGSAAFFVRHVDDEVHNPGANDPTQDFLEVWAFHVDFTNPANSTFSLLATVPVAEFESELCGLTSTACFPQPGTSTTLDPLREVVMWRLQYRNFSSHESLVGTFVTDVGGGSIDHGGLRWFELQRSAAGSWNLFQEGTWAPDADHRWLGSAAMDGSGNIVLAYSVSGNSTFPSIRYVGRTAADPTGTMTTGEQSIVAGMASQTGVSRWGDYSSLNVDPVDECSFWYTNEYVTSGGNWQTRIARFRFPSPTCVDAPPPTCGNNTRELAEQCDGTDDAACPGLCESDCSCPPPVCGNNLVERGEQCDGSADTACPGQCLPAGDPNQCHCPSICGDGVCDSTAGEDASSCGQDCGCAAQGSCGGMAPDGCYCDSICAAQGDCCPDMVSACLPPSACGTTPRTDCRQAAAGRAQLVVKDRTDDRSDQVKWRWRKGAMTDVADFLDPVGNSAAAYSLCVYDSSASTQPLTASVVSAQGTCGSRPCWKANGSKGFRYRNRSGNLSGVRNIKLKAGAAGKAQAQVKAGGLVINPPTPVPPLTLPVTVQLIADDGASSTCWQTQYSTASKNEAGRFKAKGP